MDFRGPAIVCVAAAFIIVLGFGFWLDRRMEGGLDDSFGIAAGIAIPVIACTIFWLWRGRKLTHWRPGRLTRSSQPASTSSDTAIYGRSVRQDAYDANPDETATCRHLQPIERALRRAGVSMRLSEYPQYGPTVNAACRINVPELERRFAPLAPVRYQEGYEPERTAYDHPRADLFCDTCLHTDRPASGIGVLHPDECRADTVWFPSPP